MSKTTLGALALSVVCGAAIVGAQPSASIVWTFDRLDNIGGIKTTVEGNPRVIDTPLGKAVEFDGVDDAMWIEKHPLAGAKTFTFEAIYRPDGGAFEQRWFHLAERDPKTGLLASAEHAKTGQDANARFLFELRVVDGTSWYLDAFVNGPGYNRALIFKDKLHPVGRWYHVAQTYDGKMFRSYVNGELQGEAEIAFTPQGEGAASVGTRINRRNYFKGAIRQARFTPRALTPEEFLKVEGGLSAQITDQELLRPKPENWLHYSGSYNSHRHSPMKQITPDNVARLQAKWAYHLVGQQHIQAVPIVADGVMYISQFNRVDAIDARTGSQIWQYQREPLSTTPQRGTAVHGNKVFVTTSDSTLVALDARTGATIWETTVVGDRYRFAGQAPLVAKGKIIMSGNQPSGFIQAFDVETGKHLWTWNAIPQKAGDPGSETWAEGSWKLGGGPIWVSGSFDPELNTIFYGTGQPGSQWAGEIREGDNLFSECIVALDVDTGRMKWYFQPTPHDVRDWDALEMPILIDREFRGQPRKLLVQANRNGYYYVLDRTNGRFLHGTPFVSRLNWSSALSPEGRPILIPGNVPSVQGSKTCPSTMGATNWPSPAYNPDTGYFYVIAQEGCSINFRVSDRPGGGPAFGGGYIRSPHEGEEWRFFLRALDATTGKKVWEYEHVGSLRYGPGVLSTAGGVVFAGEHRGLLTANDARTGKPLWHFNTGALITSGAISYGVNGQQYVAIVSGANVFAFGLPEP